MSAFDPGPGWREVAENDIRLGDEVISYAGGYGADPTWWVREVPVPPLPTEPFVMFRVHYSDGKHVLAWISPAPEVTARTVTGRSLEEASGEHPRITGFEVLAEPRAVTAKAVLEEIEAFFDQAWIPGTMRVLSYDLQQAMFARVRYRFGVES